MEIVITELTKTICKATKGKKIVCNPDILEYLDRKVTDEERINFGALVKEAFSKSKFGEL